MDYSRHGSVGCYSLNTVFHLCATFRQPEGISQGLLLNVVESITVSHTAKCPSSTRLELSKNGGTLVLPSWRISENTRERSYSDGDKPSVVERNRSWEWVDLLRSIKINKKRKERKRRVRCRVDKCREKDGSRTWKRFKEGCLNGWCLLVSRSW